MGEATVRDLRDRVAGWLGWVLAGERVTRTADGRPVTRLERVARGRFAAVLIDRFRQLPDVDLRRLRDDIDDDVDRRL